MTECRHGEVQLIPGIGARCGVCGTRATFQPAAPADATSTANDARVSHAAPAEGLREALEWLRGCEDSIGRFSRDHIGTVVRLDDVLALLKLAHTWPPDVLADRGVCADCGAFWPCPYAEAAGAAYYAAHEGAGR